MQKAITNPTVIQKLQAKKNKKGFTLVELVIVIAILAILAAIAIPVVSSIIQTSNNNTFISNVKSWDLVVKEVSAGVKAGMTDYSTYDKDTEIGSLIADYGMTFSANATNNTALQCVKATNGGLTTTGATDASTTAVTATSTLADIGLLS